MSAKRYIAPCLSRHTLLLENDPEIALFNVLEHITVKNTQKRGFNNYPRFYSSAISEHSSLDFVLDIDYMVLVSLFLIGMTRTA